jgi:hypothetical protein
MSDDDVSPVWPDDDRPRIPRVAGEREALTAYLEYFRATLEMKCRGLTTEQAGRRSAPPSTMSLHGVVRHLASVERWWFQQNFERHDVPVLHPGSTDFEPPPDHDLDDVARPLDWHEDVDLRWLLLRMITEYAQHCGHADLLREAIDGRTGS